MSVGVVNGVSTRQQHEHIIINLLTNFDIKKNNTLCLLEGLLLCSLANRQTVRQPLLCHPAHSELYVRRGEIGD